MVMTTTRRKTRTIPCCVIRAPGENKEIKTHSVYPIRLKKYPKPGRLIRQKDVPIMVPKFDACQVTDPKDCQPSLLDLDVTYSPGGSAAPEMSSVFTSSSNKANSEHVYEG